MAKTKKPKGLTITRNGWNFTFGWKIADKDYDAGQVLYYRINGSGSWYYPTVKKGKTSVTITLSASNYFPTRGRPYLKSIEFYVRGRRNHYTTGSGKKKKTHVPAMSDESYAVLYLAAPRAPSWSVTVEDSNQSLFEWSAANDAAGAYMFSYVQWSTILVRASTNWQGSLGAANGSGGNTGSIRRTEESELLRDDSYTRIVAARSVGPAGVSGWVYANHIYARPHKATIQNNGTSASPASGATNCVVTWIAPADATHPIDITETEWCIGVPRSGLQMPSNPSWHSAGTTRDTDGADAIRFTISETLDFDECLWVRVITKHDQSVTDLYETPSDPKIIQYGALTPPEELDVQQGGSFIVTVIAENKSDVPDSKMAIMYRPGSDASQTKTIGFIAAGDDRAIVQCPDWSSEETFSIGVYAYQGTESLISTTNGVNQYQINANMKSDVVWKGGTVAMPPSNVLAVRSPDAAGEAILTWEWSWKVADSAEISWSQNPNAWESTDEPERFELTGVQAGRWRVSGLETGVTWYFCIRLIRTTSNGQTYGPYSEPVALSLASAPSIPLLYLSKSIITKDESVTASWVYTSTDGTSQGYAEICEAAVHAEGITYSDPIAHTITEQHITIAADNWETGTTHYLCVRVTSASGQPSDNWSAPVPVTIADPLTCEITQHPFVEVPVESSDEEGNPISRSVLSLTSMPLSVTVIGAGEQGTTTIAIERAAEYRMERPDGSSSDGYAGETVALIVEPGEGQFAIEQDQLIGMLDDGAAYRLVATVMDNLGQSAQAEIEFEVHWSIQAIIPGGTVSINSERNVAFITATAPDPEEVEGLTTRELRADDVCDIYRLSADKPELIVKDAAFGVMYVDPYPAIGEGCGHRIVMRTVNGDYITADNMMAWLDLTDIDGDIVEEYSVIIDFDGDHLILPYDISLQNRWAKDFQLTPYLGGAQQGDWNPAVERTATYTLNLIADEDSDLIEGMRRLADHSGICHVRTPEGSSYAADIQVSESKTSEDWELVSYTLDVTRVDPEELDGMTYEEWIESELE